MQLTELVNSIHVIQLTGEVQRQDVSGIFYDSRKIVPGSIFVAIKGFNSDGHRYVLEALNKGAIAVILEDTHSVPDEIFTHTAKAKILVKDSRKALAEISNYYFHESSKKLKLIGITGTNGKTTTSYFLKNIIEEAGLKTGLLGTIKNIVGDKPIDSKLTTPESNELNEYLLEMVNDGCQYGVMEVSSHSLVLKRVYSLHFSAALFTNITSDHMDFHNSFENYFEAKKILFDELSENSFAIYNIDDPHAKDIIKDTKAERISFGMAEGAAFRIKNIHFDLDGTSFSIQYEGTDYNVSTSMSGIFNAYNACGAFAAAILTGIPVEDAVNGIKDTVSVPGRFEVIKHENKRVIIDYSHTADSLEKALLAIKEIVKENQHVYTVFGCGGNRDKSKRPVMGQIASRLSLKVFITSDNPRNEDPFDIINEIIPGITSNNYEVIENREEAIKSAILNTEDNAVILIAGKGHETYQEIKGVRTHFSDKEIAEKYLFA